MSCQYLNLVEEASNMTKWKFKSCHRCGGDVYIAQDSYGWYEQCLQCSFSSDLQSINEFKQQPSEIERESIPKAAMPAEIQNK